MSAQKFLEEIKKLYRDYCYQITQQCPELEPYFRYDIRMLVAYYAYGIEEIV